MIAFFVIADMADVATRFNKHDRFSKSTGNLNCEDRRNHCATLDTTTSIMKFAVFASLLTAASAFAPASQKAASTTSLNAFESELGTSASIQSSRVHSLNSFLQVRNPLLDSMILWALLPTEIKPSLTD